MMRASAGKKQRSPVFRFLENSETELCLLREELVCGSYQPKPFTQFRISDPKPRTISCADFRDRVVHHALCDICAPLIERRFITDSYACRMGKGAHRAVLRAQQFSRQYRYFLKTDIQSFFDTVDLEIAVDLVSRVFREKQVRDLWETILRHPLPRQVMGKGLPIGNLTSQWCANFYLDGLDHVIKERWQIAGYVRYMDDFVMWADEKEKLWCLLEQISRWLESHRSLKLKESATRIAPVTEGLPFLGLRVFPGCLRLQHKRLWRLRRLVASRERAWLAGEIDAADLVASVQASIGILRFWGIQGLVNATVEV
jgi:RNA-directed DNA polymerase